MNDQKKVVYLFGAGATQGCLSFVRSSVGLLMKHLNPLFLERLRDHIRTKYPGHKGLETLVRAVLGDKTDFEHVLTFFEQSPSAVHRGLAGEAREIFSNVLTGEIDKAVAQQDGKIPSDLYEGLLDLHAVEGFPERLSGLLTLNYDAFLDDAIEKSGRHRPDWCVALTGFTPTAGPDDGPVVPLVKLHGSFAWEDTFPIRRRSIAAAAAPQLWIPPGVVKEKDRYPFNTLWGRVREILDCDILRVVGWNMGPNDWDLISVLFSTRHGNDLRPPYTVELIGSPKAAKRLRKQFPYLGIRSILESARVGEILVGEYLQINPKRFSKLSADEKKRALQLAGEKRNWFFEWLKRNIEWAHIHLDLADDMFGAKRILEDAR